MRPPKQRTHLEFAEQEIVMPPGGPFGNRRFYANRQPFSRLLLQEYDRRDPVTGYAYWRRRYVVAPRQSGKTVLASSEPICYHLFEARESVIYGVLSMDMTGDKWNDDIRPFIEKSQYVHFLPKTGAGSRGGRVSAIRFLNGTTLRFATAGATTGRRGPTSRILIVTELNEWGTSSASGSDPSKLSEVEACTRAFGDRRIIYGEGTVGTKEELAWNLYETSSASRIFTPCPNCQGWSAMEREQLVGWDGENEEEARANAHWLCPLCGTTIEKQDRVAANSRCILVHKGQDVDSSGNVVGDMPPTRSLGFRWSAYHNLFTDAAELGADEYRAKQASNQEESEKAIRQSVWCIPYVPALIDDGQLDVKQVMHRIQKIGHREIPDDTKWLTIGVDVGDWHSWFILLAFRANQQIHIPDYGVIDVHSDSLERKVAVLAALREFRDTVLAGWPMQGGGPKRKPDAVWIDAGHFPGVVHQFCKESGTFPSGPWMATIGRGQNQMNKMRYHAPKRVGNEIRQIGEGWFVAKSPEHKSFQATVDADYAKRAVQSGLAIPLLDDKRQPLNNPGAITLFDPGSDKMIAKQHTKLANHFASERTVQRMVEGKGLVTEHEQHGANHWLDSAAIAMTAGMRLGFRVIKAEAVEQSMSIKDWVSRRRTY